MIRVLRYSAILFLTMFILCNAAEAIQLPDITHIQRVEVREKDQLVLEILDETRIDALLDFLTVNNNKWYSASYTYPTPKATVLFMDSKDVPLFVLWFGPDWVGGRNLSDDYKGNRLWKLEKYKLLELKQLLDITQ